MGVFSRADSPYWWLWLEGAKQPRVNTKIPIGDAPGVKRLSRRAAEDVYHHLMSNRARQRFGLPGSKESRSFEEHRTWYAEHVSTQKRGTVKELSMLRKLGEYFDVLELSAIDHEIAREWRTWRLKSVAAATVRREEELLKHLLTTAVPKYLESNPLSGFTNLRTALTDTRVLTVEEERRLLGAAPDAEAKALIICALDTLLRLSNVRTLSRPQDHGSYLFSDTKTHAIRIPVSTRLRAALDAVPSSGTQFFPTYAGQSPNEAIRMFMGACAKGHVQTGRRTGGVSFHCLRHTGATRMLAAGVDVKTVMQIGGWKSLKVLERYLHPSDERLRAAVNLIQTSN